MEQPFYKVTAMGNMITNSIHELDKIEEIRLYLEKCLLLQNGELKNKDLLLFYEELADWKEISLKDIYKTLSKIKDKYLTIHKLIEIFNENPDQIDYISEIFDKITDLAKEYWDYLPPTTNDILQEISIDIIIELIIDTWFSCLIAKMGKVFPLIKKDTLNVSSYEVSTTHFAESIFRLVAQDTEDLSDVEEVSAAKAEAKNKGTIPWKDIKSRINRD
jgi:hypothetical protein